MFTALDPQTPEKERGRLEAVRGRQRRAAAQQEDAARQPGRVRGRAAQILAPAAVLRGFYPVSTK